MSTFAVLRVDDVQRAAQEALDLLLAAGLGLGRTNSARVIMRR
jgi:hypothetical protein